jgi:hypothetical protein
LVVLGGVVPLEAALALESAGMSANQRWEQAAVQGAGGTELILGDLIKRSATAGARCFTAAGAT